MKKQSQLDIEGFGIIFYSPYALQHMAEGEDYLGEHYWMPKTF